MRWTEWGLFAYGVILAVFGVIWGYASETMFRAPWQTVVVSLIMGGLALSYLAYTHSRNFE